MTIEEQKTVKDSPDIKQMYVVKIGYEEFAFTTPDEAIRYMEAVKNCQKLKNAPYDLHGASHMPDPDAKQVETNLSTTDVFMGDEGKADTYLSYSCDHHIVKDSDVCGVSSCWRSVDVKKGDELHRGGWRVMQVEGKDVVTCFECVKRVAEAEEVGVDRVDETMIYAMWKMEQEVIERKSNE